MSSSSITTGQDFWVWVSCTKDVDGASAETVAVAGGADATLSAGSDGSPSSAESVLETNHLVGGTFTCWFF